MEYVSRNVRTFTLIELLIVISIIAILTGILLPAITNVRNSAQRVGCTNRQKQILVSASLYMDQYDYILPGYVGKYWYQHIFSQLYPNLPNPGYVEMEKLKLFRCPSEKAGFGAPSDGKFQYTHYILNAYLSGYTPSNAESRYHKSSAVKSPSSVIFLLDSGYKEGYALKWIQYVSFRHGASSGDNTQKNTCIGYFDGHVATVPRKSLKDSMLKDGYEY